MGLLDWFRRQRSAVAHHDDDEPDIIPLPSVRPPAPVFWGDAVQVNEQGLTAMVTRGPELRIEFHNLQRVAIRTTDEGPGTADVFWLLTAGEQDCLIPHGADGESELFDRLLKLPGFDNQAMIAAMTCTENGEFECWNDLHTPTLH